MQVRAIPGAARPVVLPVLSRQRAISTAIVVLLRVLGLGAGPAACSDDGSESEGSSPPVSLSGSVNDKGTEDLTGKGDTSVEMEADDFSFEHTFLKVDPGQKVEVELENEGDATHTFCRLHRSQGMQGSFFRG
jgi:hypothetical protein